VDEDGASIPPSPWPETFSQIFSAPSLVAEVGAAEHEDRGQRPRGELAEDQGHGEDDQQLVAQRALGDAGDDAELALGLDALHVARGDRGVVDDDAHRLGAGPSGRAGHVVHRCGGEPREGGDVVE
jgi:hypothetical protein